MPPGHCLGAAVEICNFLIGGPLPRRKCPGALALSKTKHTGLLLHCAVENCSHIKLNYNAECTLSLKIFRWWYNTFNVIYYITCICCQKLQYGLISCAQFLAQLICNCTFIHRKQYQNRHPFFAQISVLELSCFYLGDYFCLFLLVFTAVCPSLCVSFAGLNALCLKGLGH